MSNKNDRWSALSLKDRADLMNMYITNGISDLKEMKKHYNGIPYKDLNTSDYDYFNASPEMIPTEEGQHWDSRNPHTGQILKSENHPTFDLAVEGEKNAGYKIVRGYDGNLYSIPNQPDNYIEKPNILEGNEKEQTLSGEKPTLEEFLQAKADSTRNAALEKSYARTKGTLIPYAFGEGEKEKVKEVLEAATPYAIKFTYGPFTSEQEEFEVKNANYFLGNYYQAKKELEDNCKYGFNCIGTATDNYPAESRTNSNKDFDQNFDKYGFKYVGMDNAKPGDIAKTPTHGMIYVGTDVNGNPLFNYSDGGITEYNYKKDARYPAPYYGVYRYVGTPKLIQQWTEEYNNKKASGGRILDGTETEQTTTSESPKKLMSKDEYLNSKRQEIIDKSLENSNNRILPAVPYVINDIDEDTWRENKETLLKEFQDKLGNLPETHRDRATIVDTISKLQQELNAGPPSCVPGASCIYTATDNYGEKYRVSGNRSFRANPSKYGFTEVGLNEIAPGDIIQDFGDKNIPIHALTFMGYDKDNEALFNYSRGGADKRDIRKNAGYYFYSNEDLDYNPLNSINNDKFKHTAAAYRFVGTEDDNKQWDSEYVDYRQSYDKDWLEMAKKVQNITPTLLLEVPQSTIITTSKKANGGRILDGKTEENQTVSNTPWYQQNIQPLSPLGQAINNANAEFKYKYSNIPEEELKEQLAKKEAGLVTELVDKNGKAVFVPKGQAITPLEASIAEWLPGTGDIAELEQVKNDLTSGDYLSAGIGAGLLFLPGNVGKLWKKGKEALGLTKKASKTVRDPNLVTETINTISPNAEVADSPRRLTREAKITEAERQGIPKSERNNVAQKRSDVPKEIIDKHKYVAFDSPKVDKKLLTKAKEGYESDSPIKSFASKLTDLEIHPMFKNYIDGDEVFENPTITQYRYYLEKQGIDPDMFSSDELSKILSYNLNEIQNSATGALKDNILWHSTSKDFDAFDFEHHLGDNTRNSGIFGAGNYFSTKYPQNYGVYSQPFIVSDIDALVDYSDIKGWKTKGIFDKKDIPKGLAVSGNNTGPQAATGFGNYIEELDPYYNQFEISVPKNSGIKSIFPHPSRFIVDDSGNISLLPVNWEDVRFNYGNGGKINKFGSGGDTSTKQKYSLDETTDNGEKYIDIVNKREQEAYDALLRNGYSYEEAKRLSPILTAQSIYETGWRRKTRGNNYAGYLNDGKKIVYESPERFWDDHIKNLSNRWPNWSDAKSVEEYYDIINQTSLGLKTKKEYNEYKKKHPNTFIYSPEWENEEYKKILLNTFNRTNYYLNAISPYKDFPIEQPKSEWVKYGEDLFNNALIKNN